MATARERSNEQQEEAEYEDEDDPSVLSPSKSSYFHSTSQSINSSKSTSFRFVSFYLLYPIKGSV